MDIMLQAVTFGARILTLLNADDEGLNVDRSRAEVSSSVLQPSISR